MKAIPEFPKKRPLRLDDKPFFDRIFKKYPPFISELTFTNLFAWRRAYEFHVSHLEDTPLVISVKKRLWQIFDPLGPSEKKQSIIRACLSHNKEDRDVYFIRLPEATVSLLGSSADFSIREDCNSFDYVYRTHDLINLRGKGFDGKRNFLKRFKDLYPFVYKRLTKGDIKRCLSFQEEWCLAKDCQMVEGLESEKEAMREILKNFEYLGVQGGMIEVNNKIEAVSLGEGLNPQTFVVHIEKANGRFIGIYQAVSQFFTAAEAAGYLYVNREQDLGIPGLRHAKLSYHPCAMIKKYTLRRSA